LFLVALLVSDYTIFVAVLRFVCTQKFSVGAVVHFGLLAPPVLLLQDFVFSSLDSASAPIQSTGFRPRVVRPAVNPARDSSPLVFGSSVLGFFDSIRFHFCARSCPPLDSILSLPPMLVNAPKRFSFPAPACFVVQLLRSCFEFSHGYVRLL
jgi:hypothetical protein